MNLQENAPLKALHQISAIVANSSDMVESLRQVRRYLADIIPSDILAILVDDRERECLTAPLAFNGTFPPDNEELVISYDNALISEVLITRKSKARANLDFGKGLVKTNICSDLLVPMCTPDNVVGCLYFGRTSDVHFDTEEQANAEQAAYIISIVLERAQSSQEIHNVHDSCNRWQERYLILLETLPYAAVIVDVVSGRIEEFNAAFGQMVGYSSDEMQNIEFDKILPQKHLDESFRDAGLSAQEVALVDKNGDRIRVEISTGKIPMGESDQRLFLFKPVSPRAPSPVRDRDVVFFLLSCMNAASNSDLLTAMREPLDRLALIWAARYVSLLQRKPDNSLHSLVGFQLSDGIRKELHQPWLSGHDEEPFNQILESKQARFINNVQKDATFQSYSAVATRLGYSALVSLPLIIKEELFGLLNLFFESEREWSDVEKEALSSAGFAIATVIENVQQHSENINRSGRAETLLDLASQLRSANQLENIIEIAAQQTQQIVAFDFFSVSLLDHDLEEPQIICIANEKLATILQSKWNWEKIGDSPIGKLSPQDSLSDYPDSMTGSQYEEINAALSERVSVYLLSGNNYFGNLTLGRVQNHTFERSEVEFLRRVSSLMAEALQNIRQIEEESEDTLESKAALFEGLRTLQDELDTDAVIYRIRRIAMETMAASDCSVKLIQEDTTPAAFSEIIPGVENGLVSRQEAARLIESLIKTGKALKIENAANFFGTYCDRTGSLSWHGFGSYLLVLASKNDNPVAIISISWSTKRRIGQLEERLASEIAAYSAVALHNAQLYQKSLESAKDKEEFAFLISHELKAPMASVKSLTEFLLEDYKDVLNPEGFRFIVRIQNNLNHMENLILSLLDFSRIGHASRPFNFVHAANIINRALTSISGQIERANISVEVSEKLPVIFCDSTAMVQVFTNLISNAIKHTRDDTTNPAIEIEYQEQKSYDEFIVRDNGVGIAPEHHDKIFNLFYTVAYGGETRSSGIGLAIVKKIVEIHGGRIWVISSLGKGAEFHFTISKKPGSAVS